MMYRSAMPLWLIPILVLIGLGQTSFAAPLAITDRSAFARLHGLPSAMGAAVVNQGTNQAALSLELTSQFALDRSGDEFVLLDGETHELHWQQRWGLTDQTEWVVDLSFLNQGGGFMDHTVDQFHQTFGMPGGGREQYARNQLQYRVVSGATQFNFTESTTGIGDLGLMLRHQVWRTPAQALTVAARLDLPTGEFSRMTGSDSTDIAIALDYSDARLLRRLGIDTHWQAGWLWFGKSAALPEIRRDSVWFGAIALERELFGVPLIGQLNGHGAMFDGNAAPLARDTLQASLAIAIPVGMKYHLQFGFTEDIVTKSSPDVTFFMTLTPR